MSLIHPTAIVEVGERLGADVTVGAFSVVGSESTLRGCASDLFSDASAAAVTCAIMHPELTPASSTRYDGQPDRCMSISSATRR